MVEAHMRSLSPSWGRNIRKKKIEKSGGSVEKCSFGLPWLRALGMGQKRR